MKTTTKIAPVLINSGTRYIQRHLVENDGWGDCWKCCILYFIPNSRYELIPRLWGDSAATQIDEANAALLPYDLRLEAYFSERDAIEASMPNEVMIAAGVSPRDDKRAHAILIAREEEEPDYYYYWDPHPSGDYIKGRPYEFFRIINTR